MAGPCSALAARGLGSPRVQGVNRHNQLVLQILEYCYKANVNTSMFCTMSIQHIHTSHTHPAVPLSATTAALQKVKPCLGTVSVTVVWRFHASVSHSMLPPMKCVYTRAMGTPTPCPWNWLPWLREYPYLQHANTGDGTVTHRQAQSQGCKVCLWAQQQHHVWRDNTSRPPPGCRMPASHPHASVTTNLCPPSPPPHTHWTGGYNGFQQLPCRHIWLSMYLACQHRHTEPYTHRYLKPCVRACCILTVCLPVCCWCRSS